MHALRFGASSINHPQMSRPDLITPRHYGHGQSRGNYLERTRSSARDDRIFIKTLFLIKKPFELRTRARLGA